MTQKSEAFRQGVEDFKNNNIKMTGAKVIWVKRLVSKTEWKNFYSQISSYCLLEKKGDGYMVGFGAVGGIPFLCEVCDDNDLWKIGNQRRAQNVYPNPLEEKSEGKEIKVSQLQL